ncbi:MAG: efflux transporter outer membrane subunit [Deltaproteobacteria bacterium]|jgi:outer membrane protein, multidrug efflux system|nr:efflux transporter outer membrane subunit [Deltaproteobacteria bacterium]MBT6434142.1 efflux transporter outer membrane subunit [Deltaproteobacteria bacterium]MBT6492705.1 efflux transporter outer membrane subunit [Deltaproteobacteria bacterium]
MNPAFIKISYIAFVATLSATGLAGCIHTPNLQPKPLQELPGEFISSNSEENSGDKWWLNFNDKNLDALVEKALEGNQQLLSTWSRLDQAEAMMDAANASWWPTLNASISGGRSKQSASFPETNVISGSLQASYEIDVWGKLNNQRQAAAMDLAATRDLLESAAMTLAAEVTENWFAWIAQQSQLKLLQSQLETNTTYLELVDVRFSEGLATALDVFNLRQQVEQSRSQLEDAQRIASLLENRLAVLVGQAPGQIQLTINSELTDLPPLPATGVPAHLLKNRPDVRAAQRRVAAADARIGIALASRFPALKLTGSVGYSATTFTGLFDELIFSVLGSVTQPIFMGGALAAQQTQAEAALQEQLHTFTHSVLQAIAEVENALSNQKHEAKRLKHLQQQRDHAASALGEAKERYIAGLSEFLPVLTALGTLQRVEQSVVLSQKQVRTYRVQLCRALGGSWTQKLEKSTAIESGNPS